MKKFIKFIPCITTLAIMILIFIFSGQNADESTKSSTGFIHFIINIFDSLFNQKHDLSITRDIEHFVRKAAHFTIYSLLGFNASWMFLWVINNVKKRAVLWMSAIFCFIYACTDEIHQMFSAGRSASFSDVILDTLGAVFGSAAFLLFILAYTYFKQKKVIK